MPLLTFHMNCFCVFLDCLCQSSGQWLTDVDHLASAVFLFIWLPSFTIKVRQMLSLHWESLGWEFCLLSPNIYLPVPHLGLANLLAEWCFSPLWTLLDCPSPQIPLVVFASLEVSRASCGSRECLPLPHQQKNRKDSSVGRLSALIKRLQEPGDFP